MYNPDTNISASFPFYDFCEAETYFRLDNRSQEAALHITNTKAYEELFSRIAHALYKRSEEWVDSEIIDNIVDETIKEFNDED